MSSVLQILLILPATTAAFGHVENLPPIVLPCKATLYSGHGCTHERFIMEIIGNSYQGTSGRDVMAVQISNSCKRVQLIDDDSGSFFEGDRQDCLIKGPRNGDEAPNVSGPCGYDSRMSDDMYYCINLDTDLQDDILGVGVIGDPKHLGRDIDVFNPTVMVKLMAGGLVAGVLISVGCYLKNTKRYAGWENITDDEPL